MIALSTATVGLWITMAKPALAVKFNDTSAVINPELTSAAMTAARAGDFFNWAFNFSKPTSGTITTNIGGVLSGTWNTVFKLVLIVYVVIAVIIGFSYILRASWLNRWRRYIPWLIASLAGATFSFIIALAVINFTDKTVNSIIGTYGPNHFLKIGDYAMFVDLKSMPDINSAENVQNTLALLKLLTWTAYGLGIAFVVRNVVYGLWSLCCP